MASKPEPQPVEVTNTEPLPVVLAPPPEHPAGHATTKANVVAAKASVDAEALTREGQRNINIIWERTQQVIALAVVLPTIGVSAILCVFVVLNHDATDQDRAIAFTAFTLLATLTGSVIGFYFGRTNHARTGGIGGEQVTRDR